MCLVTYSKTAHIVLSLPHAESFFCPKRLWKSDLRMKKSSDQKQCPMFVYPIQFVNDGEWISLRDGSIVGLKLLNELECVEGLNALYFSCVVPNFFFRSRLSNTDWEGNRTFT